MRAGKWEAVLFSLWNTHVPGIILNLKGKETLKYRA